MMTLSLLRCFFIVISTVTGYYIGNLINESLFGGQIGCLVALMIIIFEQKSKAGGSLRGLTSMVFGLILGVIMANLLSDIFSLVPVGDFFHSTARIILTIIFSYLGAAMALRGKDEFNIIIPYIRFKRQNVKEGIILLDTSVVIDGRVSSIYKSNFLMGRLVVPRFVLNELQKLADSLDEKKRERGRRGLELLHQMQNDSQIDIHIHEEDMGNIQEVDLKLIQLSKLLDAQLCTTD